MSNGARFSGSGLWCLTLASYGPKELLHSTSDVADGLSPLILYSPHPSFSFHWRWEPDMRGLVGQHPDGLKAGGEAQIEGRRSNAGSEA